VPQPPGDGSQHGLTSQFGQILDRQFDVRLSS